MKPTYNDLVELIATRDQELADLRQELKESRKREAARDQEIAALKHELTALKEEFKAMVDSTDELIKKANARYFQDSWHDIVNALVIMHANLTLLPPPPTCSGHALM